MWIDRYNLLRRLVPPPRSPDALISLILRVIFPMAISLHLLASAMFYSFELALISADPPCEAGEQPVVCRLASDPHLAPCQTARTVAQAERAMGIIWLSLCVWGAMLAFYVTREARRKEDGTLTLPLTLTLTSHLSPSPLTFHPHPSPLTAHHSPLTTHHSPLTFHPHQACRWSGSPGGRTRVSSVQCT